MEEDVEVVLQEGFDDFRKGVVYAVLFYLGCAPATRVVRDTRLMDLPITTQTARKIMEDLVKQGLVEKHGNVFCAKQVGPTRSDEVKLYDVGGSYPTLTVTLENVLWVCMSTNKETLGRVRITIYDADRVPDYISLRNMVDKLARSRRWLTEDLAAELARRLSKLLWTRVVVEVEHEEKPSMWVRVTVDSSKLKD